MNSGTLARLIAEEPRAIGAVVRVCTRRPNLLQKVRRKLEAIAAFDDTHQACFALHKLEQIEASYRDGRDDHREHWIDKSPRHSMS